MKVKHQFNYLLIACFLLWQGVSNGLTAEKLNFATGVGLSPHFFLPVVAAEEKGFWKVNGLEVQWVDFKGSTPMHKAVAAGEINLGLDASLGVPPAAAAGVPAIIIGDLNAGHEWYYWVHVGSRFRELRELSGAKFGTSRLGVASHIYGIIAAKALGLKNVKFIATGGVVESMASLKAGVIDVVPSTFLNFVELEARGEARRIGSVAEFLPREWVARVIFARKDFIKRNPDTVRKALKALSQAVGFIENNPGWSVNKMMAARGFSERSAKEVYAVLNFTKGFKINERALDNVRKFLIEWGLVPKEKMPPLEELYTKEFTG